MKLHVVFDKNGAIVGAAQLGGAAPVQARPMADDKAGHRAAEVDVPAEYHQENLATICRKLRVHADGKVPQLKPKD